MLAGATVFWRVGGQFSGWVWVDVVADDSSGRCADGAGRDRRALGAGGRAQSDDDRTREDKLEVRLKSEVEVRLQK